MFSSQFAKVFMTYQTFVTNLHLLRVELRCKLQVQEKLHCVTGPIDAGEPFFTFSIYLPSPFG